MCEFLFSAWCSNNSEHEAIRKEAVEATLERNPHAFRPKIASSPSLSSQRARAHQRVRKCRPFCLVFWTLLYVYA